MSECNDCGSQECRNGTDCNYKKSESCNFCHCSGNPELFECNYCGAGFIGHDPTTLECAECGQSGCSDCFKAECEGCAVAVHYDGEGGEPCAAFVGDQYYYVMCSWCEENRGKTNSNNVPKNDSEPGPSCPDCGYELDDFTSLEDHRTDDDGSCDHERKTTSGDQEVCYCCGTELGYWQTNGEYYDTIGAPYDD